MATTVVITASMISQMRNLGIKFYVNNVEQISNNDIPIDGVKTIKLTPPTGKEFVLSGGFYVYWSWYISGQTREVVFSNKSSDGISVYWEIDRIINQSGQNPKTITYNLQDSSSVINLSWVSTQSTVVYGNSITFTWANGDDKAHTVKIIKSGVVISTSESSTHSYATSSNLEVGSYSIEVTDGLTTLSSNFAVTETPPDYVLSTSDVNSLDSNHVTIKINGVVGVVGSKLKYGDSLIATAADGWEFIKSATTPKSSIHFRTNILGVIKYGDFTISEDNKTATYTFVAPSTDHQYSWSSLNVLTTQSADVYGSNNVYKITDDILGLVNGARFTTTTGAGGESEVYDYGQFILSVLQLPFNIDPDLILTTENIMLATLDTKVAAPKLSTDKIKLDLGSISVPKSHNNLLDYIDTTAIIHLPRVEPMAIDLIYVIGETVSIKYIVDCYTGIATVNIYSTKINDVVITRQVNLGVEIPYANTMTSRSVDNAGINIGGDNGVTTPYIEIVKSDFIKPDGFFTIPIIDESLLSSQAGFVKVVEVELKTTAIKSEKDELISILNNGVIIK